MRRRIDPWTELRYTASSAIRVGGSPSAVALLAERCRWCSPDMGDYGLALNALKSLCLAWGRAPDNVECLFKAAVTAALAGVDTWDMARRVA